MRCWVISYLGEERDLVAQLFVLDALVFGPAAKFDARVHCGGDEGLEDEEVDGHVSVEGELESAD